MAQYLPVLWEHNILIKHRAGSANKVADTLSQPLGMDEGSEDNQDVVVLPDHLFTWNINTSNLKQQIQKCHVLTGTWSELSQMTTPSFIASLLQVRLDGLIEMSSEVVLKQRQVDILTKSSLELSTTHTVVYIPASS